MKLAPILKTERLVLRGIEEMDTDYIVALRSDSEVYKYFFQPHKITAEEHREWFKNQYIWQENRIDWLAIEKASEKPVGILGVKRDFDRLMVAEVSYLLAPEVQGKGYASEAVKCIMEFAKEKWSCTLCIAEIHVENYNSIKFAKNLGFTILEMHDSFVQYGKSL